MKKTRNQTTTKTTTKTTKYMYRPVYVDGRWYPFNCNTGRISRTLSFVDKEFTESHCAMLMNLRVENARSLWALMDAIDEAA